MPKPSFRTAPGRTFLTKPPGVSFYITDNNTMAALFVRMRHMSDVFVRALNQVVPEFGAYAPYSIFQESGRTGWGLDSGPSRRHQYYPHIEPAIMNNADYVVRNVSEGLRPILRDAAEGNAPRSVSVAEARVRRVWEDVLNRKPRADAINMAPREFGFHRSTIRGYGKARTDRSVRDEQERIIRERELLRRTGDRTAAGRRTLKRLAGPR